MAIAIAPHGINLLTTFGFLSAQQCRQVVDKSRVVWENLEAWVREKIQGYVQDLLEEEVVCKNEKAVYPQG
jgi:hypothetical protein